MEALTSTCHLTVVQGSIRHDVAVDPRLSVGEVLSDVLGDGPGAGSGGVPLGAPWRAISLMGEVVSGGDSIERAGLVDGSVIVAATTATLSWSDPADASRGVGRVGGARGARHHRRGRSGERATSGSRAVRVAGYCAMGLGVVLPAVVGMSRTTVPLLHIALVTLAIAAALSRVVPDLILRLPPSAPVATPTGPAPVRGTGTGGASHDNASVQRWVRLVARRQVGANLGVLVVVLLASGVLLIALMARIVTGGLPVATPAAGPALLSIAASAMVLAGSARGRSRADRWMLRVAAATAAVPVVSVAAASMSTPIAVGAAYACVVVGLAALVPSVRQGPPRLRRSRLASGLDVLVVVAVLPLACWAAGLVSGVQAWVHGSP